MLHKLASHSLARMLIQVIEELFTYWNLDDADATLEELEDALIVSCGMRRQQVCSAVHI